MGGMPFWIHKRDAYAPNQSAKRGAKYGEISGSTPNSRWDRHVGITSPSVEAVKGHGHDCDDPRCHNERRCYSGHHNGSYKPGRDGRHGRGALSVAESVYLSDAEFFRFGGVRVGFS